MDNRDIHNQIITGSSLGLRLTLERVKKAMKEKNKEGIERFLESLRQGKTTMNTRCKFKVTEVTKYNYGGKVKLNAVHDSTLNKEDHAYATATPSGTLEISVSKVDLVDNFKPGEFYYLDLIPVPKPE